MITNYIDEENDYNQKERIDPEKEEREKDQICKKQVAEIISLRNKLKKAITHEEEEITCYERMIRKHE